MEVQKVFGFALFFTCFAGNTIITVSGNSALQTESNHEKTLREGLLSKYNPEVRPVLDSTKALDISLDIMLTAIQGVDERNQIMTLALWMRQTWEDAFLKWNPADHGGVERIIVKQSEIWIPDIALYNSADSVYGDLFNPAFKAHVDHDGTVYFASTGSVRVSCPLRVHKYPFDNQTCGITIAPWAYNEEEINFANVNYSLTYYRPNGEWNLTSFAGEVSRCPFTKIQVIYTEIAMTRKPEFILMNLFIPCVFMSVLCMLVFLLPADAGEKVSLGITVLLSFAVFLLVISDNLPKSSDEIPLLSLYVILTMALAAMSLGCSVLVLNVHHKSGRVPVPRWIKVWIIHYMGNILFCSKVTTPHENKIKTQEKFPNLEEMVAEVEDIYQNQEKKIKLANFTGLETIEAHLCKITRAMEDSEAEEENRKQWQEVAAILDRFFLVMYAALVFFVSVIMMGVIPQTEE